MQDESEPFVVEVPAGFTPRFASLFNPQTMLPGMANVPPRYGCNFPANEVPPDLRRRLGVSTPTRGWKSQVRTDRDTGLAVVRATSTAAPIIIPRAASSADLISFACLKHLCEQTAMPMEWIFRERHLRLQVQAYSFQGARPYPVAGMTLRLHTVQVVDLEEGFLRRELKRRFEQYQDEEVTT